MSQLSNKKLIDYFNIPDLDASKVTWAHAVNSRKKVSDALERRISLAKFFI